MTTRSAAKTQRPKSGPRKELLATLGPSSLNRKVIAELDEAGVTCFRVNMSHTDLDRLGQVIDLIRGSTQVPICVDTEGAQMRTGVMRGGVQLQEGTRVRLVSNGTRGDSSTIPVNPGGALRCLRPSARVSVDFDSVLLRVDRVHDGEVAATVLVGGEVATRRAVTAYPPPPLPTFSPKDLLAVKQARRLGIHAFALSHCVDRKGVDQLRRMIGKDDIVMAKIENRAGVRHLGRIAEAADRIIIDRGDLSREVRLEAIPLLQKTIIRRANALGTPIYVATNLLESMVARRAPTRAEVNDVINTLLDGADGLVLAAETAIGKYPVEAARMIAALMKEYEGSIQGYKLDELLGDHPLAPR